MLANELGAWWLQVWSAYSIQIRINCIRDVTRLEFCAVAYGYLGFAPGACHVPAGCAPAAHGFQWVSKVCAWCRRWSAMKVWMK